MKDSKSTKRAMIAVLVGLFAALVSASDAAEERALRRSDVIFMYDNPKLYEAYGCTAIGWGRLKTREEIADAHARGVRSYTKTVGFITEFRGMIDFSENFLDAAAHNFAGEPFTVPWLADHHHKGQPAWWLCANSPLCREYLESLLKERMLLDPDGLHVDDYRSSSHSVTFLSGGFCRHCLAGFRQYLADNVPAEKLSEIGISELDQFDYRQFLIDQGVTPQQYRQQRRQLPLAEEFEDFHVKANKAYVAQFHKLAQELCGKPLTLSVNAAGFTPGFLAITKHLSYFCCEVNHHASKLAPTTHPIYVYKMGEGLNRPVASTASGGDWAFVKEHNKPCLVRTWIALSYAFGQTLMAPQRQWCHTKEKGTHYYFGPTEQYAYLYRFIRDHAALFDGYETIAPVAVVYDNAARRKRAGDIEPVCIDLAQRNVPFDVVVAGDDWLDYRLDGDRLKRYRAVITVGDTQWMDEAQHELLADVKETGRLVTWPNEQRLEALSPRPVLVEGSEHVMVVPRAIPDNDTAPIVVHLLNRQYDGATDAVIPQRNFTVRLRLDLLQGRSVSQATLHAPKSAPVKLPVASDDETVTITVPSLSLWGLVELGE